MKLSVFRWARGILLGILLSFCCVAVAFAEASPSVSSNALKVQKQVGGVMQEMNMTEVCTETDPSGAKKICLCMSVCYRIAQVLANTAWTDGVFRSWDVDVETRWNTDGPEEFFVHAAEVPASALKISDGATPDKDLTLQDSWFRVKVRSTGKVYEFRGTDRIYKGDFLALRSKKKNGTITAEEDLRYAELRKQVVAAMTTPPFAAGAFEMTASAGGNGSGGGCSLGGAPLAALLLLPLGFLRRRG